MACWQSCRGPHDVFDLEITSFLGNSLCNEACNKADLQKIKKDYLSSISTPSPLFRNGVLWHEVKLILNEKKSVPLKCFLC